MPSRSRLPTTRCWSPRTTPTRTASRTPRSGSARTRPAARRTSCATRSAPAAITSPGCSRSPRSSRAIAASRCDLDHRVPVRSKDEVGAVASAFNFMMEDLRTSKERLVIAERIAAWQEIARRLAHEIKNPLTPIQMAMDTLRKTWKKKHPSFGEILEESTATVMEEADRLKHIVSEFSAFARMPKPGFQRLDLNELVRSALALYQGG